MKRIVFALAAALAFSLSACNNNSSSPLVTLQPQNLYAVDFNNGKIYVYNLPANASSTPAVTLSTGISGGLYGAAFDPSGNLFVINDFANPSIVYGYSLPLTSSSTPFATVTIAGSNNAFEIAFDPSGNLWVADAGNARVRGYHGPFSGTITPTAFATVPTGGTAWSVASDAASNIYAVAGNHIVRFGAPVSSASSANAALSTLTEPIPMAFDPSGNLYAADFQTGQLVRYNAPINDGASPAINDPGSTTGLAGAYGMALDRNGTLFVANCSATVKAFATSTFSNTSAPSFTITLPAGGGCSTGLAIR